MLSRRWFEIASFPQYFQRGCVATRADYSRREDGRIREQVGRRDDQKPSAGAQALERSAGVVMQSDEVEDHVHAPDRVLERLRPIVHDVLDAELAQRLVMTR